MIRLKVKFTLPEDVVKKCFNFAAEIVTGKNQTSPDFGDPENIRGEVDKIADSFEGKLAEYAFSLFLADLSKKQFIINPDLNIYSGKSNIDYGNDLSDVSFRKRHHEFNRLINDKAFSQPTTYIIPVLISFSFLRFL